MAGAAQNVNEENLDTMNYRQLLASNTVARRVSTLQKAAGIVRTALTDHDDVNDDAFDLGGLLNTILTAVNGHHDVKPQKVRVEYLTQDQLLAIPAALAMHPFSDEPGMSEAERDPVLLARYNKMRAMSYRQILEIVEPRTTIVEKRQAFNDLNVVAPNDPTMPWLEEGFYVRPDGEIDDDKNVVVMYGMLSRSLQFNCDIRDVGFLVLGGAHTRLPDNICLNTDPIPTSRFKPQLRSYTLETIAALNMPACRQWVLGSWVRVYGLACGILPNRDTLLNQEWKFVKKAATLADLASVRGIHERIGDYLPTLCLNILAMFGLLHLNKNHTFKSGDANMERICTSYIQTLCTMVKDEIIDDLKANMEVACRTAAHPFGLGQTYWLAHALHSIGGLATPLAIRLDVSPPLVQRLFIVRSAANEWENMSSGEAITAMFEHHMRNIDAEIALVRANPLAYSELHQLYGIPQMAVVSAGAKASADAMMPMVSGFAQAMHVDQMQKKDGLALAMSLLNVERDSKVATDTYTNLWASYLLELRSKHI